MTMKVEVSAALKEEKSAKVTGKKGVFGRVIQHALK
jgi:hypothetical protein